MASNRFDHRTVCFWSWNDEMSIPEVEEQMRQFADGRYGGVVIHARAGLTIPYLGEEWFAAFEAAVKAAEKCGMEVWIYDENGWPSGYGNGVVTDLGEAYWQKHLCVCPYADVPASGHPVAVFRKTGNAVCRVPLSEAEKSDVCYYYGCTPRYVDLLDHKVTEEFIKSTHEVYKARVGGYFGTVIKGVFTDEPQLDIRCLPWSFVLEGAYRAAYCRDLLDDLWLLTHTGEGYRRVRREFWTLVGKLMQENFSRPLSEWCAANGLKLTGHFAVEDGLESGIACNGGVMPHYRYFQLPAIDHLGNRCATPVLMKQVASVARQFGDGQVMSETFGCSGWGVSFKCLQRVWGWQAALGITKPCLHLAAYTMRGVRKRDYPAFFSYQEPWWDEFRYLTDWMDGLDGLMTEGERLVDVLVIPPFLGAMSEYRGEQETNRAVRRYSGQFRGLLEDLLDTQIDFELGDERMLATDGRVEDGKMLLGRGRYGTVIVSETDDIAASTVALLRDFTAQGGKLVFVNRRPTHIDGTDDYTAESLPAFDMMRRRDLTFKYFAYTGVVRPLTVRAGEKRTVATGIVMHARTVGDTLRVHLFDRSGADRRDTFVYVPGRAGLVRVDPASGARTPLFGQFDGTYTVFSLTLTDGESAVLETVPAVDLPHYRVTEERLLPAAVRVEEDNTFILDCAGYRINGGEPSPEAPVVNVVDKLYADIAAADDGRDIDVTFTYRFNAAAGLSRMQLAAEPTGCRGIAVNGTAVGAPCGWFMDKSFALYNIGGLLRAGENTVEMLYRFPGKKADSVEMSPTDLSHFSYPVEPESIYLRGAFDVKVIGETLSCGRYYRLDGGFELIPPTEKGEGDLTPQGMWFYRGAATYTVTVPYDGTSRTSLVIEGLRDTVATVTAGGVTTPVFAAGAVDLTDRLTVGDNTVTVRLPGNNRNLLGPHHHVGGENDFVGVDTFKGNYGFSEFPTPEVPIAPTWDGRYAVIPFGVEAFRLRRELPFALA